MGRNNLNLAEHLLRTWIYVQAVDINYKDGLVSPREVFERKD
jgi:hypothetical protein